MNNKSKCCKVEMEQTPDEVHFHYYCPKCNKEYELDGVTRWENLRFIRNTRKLPEHPKPHSCKCNRHPDSAFTVIKLDEGLSKCPRCGGIIIPRLPKQTTQPSHTDVTLEEIEKIIALKMAQMIIEDLPDKLGYTKARILAQAILERITKDK